MSNTWQTYARDFDKYTIGQGLDPDIWAFIYQLFSEW